MAALIGSSQVRQGPELPRYAQKELSAADKLTKQLFFALQDPGIDKVDEEPPFEVAIPLFYKLNPQEFYYLPFASGAAQHSGGRAYQEDGYISGQEVSFSWGGQEKRGQLYAVIDGHSDLGEISVFLQRALKQELEGALNYAGKSGKGLDETAVTDSLVQAFQKCATGVQESNIEGGAVVTCLFRIDDQIYVANVGDSSALLIQKEGFCRLTENGNLGYEDQLKERFARWYRHPAHRVEIFPRYDTQDPAVNGRFNLARSISSFSWMCCRPKITRIFLGDHPNNLKEGKIYAKNGDFLILASDGLWEPATDAEIVAAVRNVTRRGIPLAVGAELIAAEAGNRPQNDNVTVMLIAL